MLKLEDEGVAYMGTPASRTEHCGFPGILSLSDDTLLMSWRVGSSKDSADGTIYISRCVDRGRTWSPPAAPFSTSWEGVPGNLHICKFTETGQGHVLACLMWIDRTNPTAPMYNPQTEGIFPMKVLFARSADYGQTWGPLWALDDSPYGSTLGMTGPVLVLRDGRWACQFEVNKPYDDPRPWRQVAALKFSSDEGRIWSAPVEVANDPTGRVRYWDQRHAVAPDGDCLATFWTFDAVRSCDLNITLSTSHDGGQTWSPPRDTGLSGQLPYPVFLSDGRLLLLYIDRYETQTVRARLGDTLGRQFDERDTVIYQHCRNVRDPGHDVASSADHLQDQQRWTFGYVSGATDSQGDVWVTYYSVADGNAKIHWAHMRC